MRVNILIAQNLLFQNGTLQLLDRETITDAYVSKLEWRMAQTE
jgi:hypothetical protein